MRGLLHAILLLSAAAAADPHTDYMLYCRGCHLHTGEAVPSAYVPSLHELAPFLASAAGREYLVRVPGVSQTPVSDERLAAVMNWVLTEFNADTLPEDFEPYTAEEIGAARKKVLENPLAARAAILRQ